MSDFNTRLVHAGHAHPRIEGAVTLPIFQSATYEQPSAEDPIHYIRYNNSPNHRALHEKISAIEGTEAGLVTASGMGAITSTLLSLLAPGDHVLIHEGCYGGTHALVTRFLRRLRIGHTFIPKDLGPAAWEALLQPETRVFYTESITNPSIDVLDLEGVVAFSKAHNLTSVIDNTFGTPVNYRPAESGFDVVLHSATKYYNGHSDLLAGVVAGDQETVAKIEDTLRLTGASLDPHACFLLERSMKTLGLRVQHQNRTGEALATFLEAEETVSRVRYPGLPSHPNHDRAKKLFDGFGGMMSFELAPGVDVDRFLTSLEIPVRAPSLGGPETLITRPAFSSHKSLSNEERSALGISDALLRVSVGFEEAEALIQDFGAALAKAKGAA